MQITLTPTEGTMLREILSSCLVELRREIVHTDSHDYRDMLREREKLIDRLIGDLGRTAA